MLAKDQNSSLYDSDDDDSDAEEMETRVCQTYKVKNKSENIHPHSPQIDALGRAISKNVIFIKFEACSDSIPWLLKFYYKFYYNLS